MSSECFFQRQFEAGRLCHVLFEVSHAVSELEALRGCEGEVCVLPRGLAVLRGWRCCGFICIRQARPKK
jgi:hypothetical protein